MSIQLLNQDSFIRYHQNFLFNMEDRNIVPVEIYKGEKILSFDYISKESGELKTYLITPKDQNSTGEKRVSRIIRSGDHFFNEEEVRWRDIPDPEENRIANINTDASGNYRAFCVLEGSAKRVTTIMQVEFPDGFKLTNGMIQPDHSNGVSHFTVRSSMELLGVIVKSEDLQKWMITNSIEKVIVSGITINQSDTQDCFITIKDDSFDVQYFTRKDLSTSLDLSCFSLQPRKKQGGSVERGAVSILLLSDALAISTDEVLHCIDRAAIHYFREGLTKKGLLAPEFRIKNILSGSEYLVNNTLSSIHKSLLKGGSSNAFISKAVEELPDNAGQFEKNNISDILSSNYSMEYRKPREYSVELNYLFPEAEVAGSESDSPQYLYEDDEILNTNDARPSIRAANLSGGGYFSYVTVNGVALSENSIQDGIISPVSYSNGVFTLWLADLLPAEDLEGTQSLTNSNGLFAYIPALIKDRVTVEMVRKQGESTQLENPEFEVVGNVMRITAPKMKDGYGIHSIQVRGQAYSISKTVVVGPVFEKSGGIITESARSTAQYFEGQNYFRLPVKPPQQRMNIPLFTTGIKISRTNENDFIKSVFFNTAATFEVWEELRFINEKKESSSSSTLTNKYTLYNGHPHIRITITKGSSKTNYYAMLFMDAVINRDVGYEILTWSKSSGHIYDNNLNEVNLIEFLGMFNMSKVILIPEVKRLVIDCNGKGSDVDSVDVAVGGYLVPWNNRKSQYRYNLPYRINMNDGYPLYSRDGESIARVGHDNQNHAVVVRYDLQDKKVVPGYKIEDIMKIKNLNYQHKKIVDLTHCNHHVYIDIEVTYKKEMTEFSSIVEPISRFIFAMKEHRFTGSFKETFFYDNMHKRKYKKAELHIGFPVLFMSQTQMKGKTLSDFVDVKINIRQKARKFRR